MTITRTASFVLAALALASCGSSPKTNFYDLTVSSAAAPAAAAKPGLLVQVAAVHVPPSLDRREMVSRTGGQSIKVSDTDRWSAPFGDMVRNVLSQDLQANLPKGAVVLPEAPAPSATESIVVDIANFEPDASGNIRLAGSWSLLKSGGDKPILRRDFDLSENGGKGAQAAAAGMSRAVGRLAAEIASSLGTPAPSHSGI